ncbi:MAG TPA: BMP family protein [Synergistales bacterium]|nr:BMP family protein [Synergistales bacterium]
MVHKHNYRVILFVFFICLLSITIILPAFAQEATKDGEMILILPGEIRDMNWNQTNFTAFSKVSENIGIKCNYMENVPVNQLEEIVKRSSDQGMKLIIIAGSQYSKVVDNIASDFPEIHFCIINGELESDDRNVTSIIIREYEASFLAGIIAGFLTDSGKIGLAGGESNNLMIMVMNAFESGSRVGSPNVKPIRTYIHSWKDVELGRQIASSMIDKGADILFFYANTISSAIITEAEKENVRCIGFTYDQNNISPDTVIASVYYDLSPLYSYIIEGFSKEELVSGNSGFGLTEGIFAISYGSGIPDHIRQIVSDAEDSILRGQVIEFLANFPEGLNNRETE